MITVMDSNRGFVLGVGVVVLLLIFQCLAGASWGQCAAVDPEFILTDAMPKTQVEAIVALFRTMTPWVYARICCAPYLNGREWVQALLKEGGDPVVYFNQCQRHGERESDDLLPELPPEISSYEQCSMLRDDEPQ